jgi:hypothetical protein
MFKWHWGRAKVDNANDNRGLGLGGFTGLEGDFEAERRRAAAAGNDPIDPYEPYEQDQIDKPNLPGSSSGLTHP